MKYVCKCCGVEFSASPSRGRKYCSHACNARVNFGIKKGVSISELSENAPVLDKASGVDDFQRRRRAAVFKRMGRCVEVDDCGNERRYDVDGNLIED